MKTAGFVLTGGRSSRMGRDKARLPVGDSTLVESIAGTLAKITDEVLLVGRPERYGDLGMECLPDLRADLGPLSGIEAALASGRANLNVIVSCDLAGLQAEWISSLLGAMKPGVVCAAAIDLHQKLQPLCAVYTSESLSIVRRALDENRLRALDLLAELKAVPVPIHAVIPNLNTPEQFDAWMRRATII